MTDIAKRNARNKRNGTLWESKVRDELRNLGFDYEKLRLAGAQDEGDGVIRLDAYEGRVVIEAKSGAFKPEHVLQAAAEARNYEDHRDLGRGSAVGVTIAKYRGRPFRQAIVAMTLDEFLTLTEWVEAR